MDKHVDKSVYKSVGKSEEAKKPAEKPISLRPLEFEEAVTGLMRVKPEKSKAKESPRD